MERGIPVAPFLPCALSPNKSGASQLVWRLSKVFCPHCLATVLFKGGEKALEVPFYLPRKYGLVSVMESTMGQSSCPAAQSD